MMGLYESLYAAATHTTATLCDIYRRRWLFFSRWQHMFIILPHARFLPYRRYFHHKLFYLMIRNSPLFLTLRRYACRTDAGVSQRNFNFWPAHAYKSQMPKSAAWRAEEMKAQVMWDRDIERSPALSICAALRRHTIAPSQQCAPCGECLREAEIATHLVPISLCMPHRHMKRFAAEVAEGHWHTEIDLGRHYHEYRSIKRVHLSAVYLMVDAGILQESYSFTRREDARALILKKEFLRMPAERQLWKRDAYRHFFALDGSAFSIVSWGRGATPQS